MMNILLGIAIGVFCGVAFCACCVAAIAAAAPYDTEIWEGGEPCERVEDDPESTT